MLRSGQIFRASLVVFAAVVIQSTWAAGWRVAGTLPDIVLTVVLLVGVILGPRHAALQGFWGGYLCGTLSGSSLGSFMVSRLFAGYLVGLAQRVMVQENPLVTWASVFGGTLVAEVIFFLMNPTPALQLWMTTVLKEAVFNTLISAALYPLLLHVLHPSAQSGVEAVAADAF